MTKLEINETCYDRFCSVDGMDITELSFDYKKKVISSFITPDNIDEMVRLFIDYFGEIESTHHCDQCGTDTSKVTLNTNLKTQENDTRESSTESKASQFRNTNFPPGEADFL